MLPITPNRGFGLTQTGPIIALTITGLAIAGLTITRWTTIAPIGRGRSRPSSLG